MEDRDTERCKTCVHFKKDKCHSIYDDVCNGWTHHNEKWWVMIRDLLLVVFILAVLLGPTLLIINWSQNS